ncbi:MAG: hypothetical protein HY235_25820 [Acidobacteria bacterium]|nr:hypothetical protein [Acidobacteriota bacterium]
MSASAQQTRPNGHNWLSRNVDLVALTAIVLFSGMGSWFSGVFGGPWLIHRTEPVIEEIRPQVWQIHDEMRKAIREAEEEIRRNGDGLRQDLEQTREDLRRLKGELREALPHRTHPIE